MNKAFENILEKLEERTSFLSDCMKYGNKDAEQQNKSYSTMMMYEVADLVDDLIEIVKQEAEKCNNGWIPCSERLPEESGTYIVNAIENSIIHVTFAKWMPRMKKWNLTGCRSYWKVNAWQPLPEPFKERD